MPNRVIFLVDGFNLYHSIRDVHRRTGHNYRWLDLKAVCSSFLPHIGSDASLRGIHYFSALAHHVESKNPGAVARHRIYVSALEATAVSPELGQFKRKEIGCICPQCGNRFLLLRHEEKETDVAIACRLLECILDDSVDSIAIVSGDTDLVPAVKSARRLSNKPVYMLYPVGRRNRAFLGLAAGSFRLKEAHYRNHQLPDPLVAGSRVIRKPAEWR